MVTFFVIFIIVACILAARKDKHNKEEDDLAIANLPSFSILAKPMSTFSKIINLAINKRQLLHSFSYTNGTVTLVTEDGRWLSSELSNLKVQFEKVNGIVSYSLTSKNQKMKFYQTTNITSQEWDAINGVLCLASTTWGRSIFSKQAKNLGRVITAMKFIKAIS